jgi:hypothetical protein
MRLRASEEHNLCLCFSIGAAERERTDSGASCDAETEGSRSSEGGGSSVRLVLPETESSAAVAGVPDPLGVSSEEIKSSSWAREEAGRSMGVTARDTLADNAARRSSRSLRSEASCCRFFSSSASARD